MSPLSMDLRGSLAIDTVARGSKFILRGTLMEMLFVVSAIISIIAGVVYISEKLNLV